LSAEARILASVSAATRAFELSSSQPASMAVPVIWNRPHFSHVMSAAAPSSYSSTAPNPIDRTPYWPDWYSIFNLTTGAELPWALRVPVLWSIRSLRTRS